MPALPPCSAEAAKQITAIIAEASSEVGAGVDLVARTGQSLGEIMGKVSSLDAIIDAIASSAAEQSNGLRDINRVVETIDGMTRESSAMMQESVSASHALRQEAEAPADLIGKFQISTAPRPHGTDMRAPSPPAGSLRRAGWRTRALYSTVTDFARLRG